jgi:hypothetical protein
MRRELREVRSVLFVRVPRVIWRIRLLWLIFSQELRIIMRFYLRDKET